MLSNFETKILILPFAYGQIVDRYGVDPELPDGLRCIRPIYVAYSPGSDLWVCLDDPPEEICSALWEKHRRNLAFPVGLSLTPEEEVKLKLRGGGTQ